MIIQAESKINQYFYHPLGEKITLAWLELSYFNLNTIAGQCISSIVLIFLTLQVGYYDYGFQSILVQIYPDVYDFLCSFFLLESDLLKNVLFGKSL